MAGRKKDQSLAPKAAVSDGTYCATIGGIRKRMIHRIAVTSGFTIVQFVKI
jgi:hypothetical protein